MAKNPKRMTDSAVVPDLFDVRLRNQYLKTGVLSKKELDAHLDSLEDVAELAEEVNYNKLILGGGQSEAPSSTTPKQGVASSAVLGVPGSDYQNDSHLNHPSILPSSVPTQSPAPTQSPVTQFDSTPEQNTETPETKEDNSTSDDTNSGSSSNSGNDSGFNY